MAVFEFPVTVSFGDCDPAGIVYYPNYFRWMDNCFHAYLQELAGGHRAVCEKLGAVGLGLMNADQSFRAPAREGDKILYLINEIKWSGRSYKLDYTVWSGNLLVLEGHETRGVFVLSDGRMRAGDTAPLKKLLATDTQQAKGIQ